MEYFEVVTPGNSSKFQTIDEKAAYREKSRRRRKNENAVVERRQVNNELSKLKNELSK